MELLKWRKHEETSRIRPVDIHLICAYFYRQVAAAPFGTATERWDNCTSEKDKLP